MASPTNTVTYSYHALLVCYAIKLKVRSHCSLQVTALRDGSYIDAGGTEDSPEPVYTYCLVLPFLPQYGAVAPSR